MKLFNKKTQIVYFTRTMKDGCMFISIVERWETDINGIPFKAFMSSREFHPTRNKARHYANSVARYQFKAHCACYGM